MFDRLLKFAPSLVAFAFFVLCVLCAAVLDAQVTYPVTITTGSFQQYGYKSPYLNLGAGIEARSAHVLVIAGAGFSPTAKIQAGNGYDLSAGGTVFGKVGHVIAGAGAAWGRTSNTLWTKQATRPQAAIGLDADNYRVILARTLKGADRNDLVGYSLGAGWRIAHRVWFGIDFFQSRFISGYGPQSAKAFAASLSYRFGER